MGSNEELQLAVAITNMECLVPDMMKPDTMNAGDPQSTHSSSRSSHIALTVTITSDSNGITPHPRRLTTPKKKWMQLWSAQHAGTKQEQDALATAATVKATEPEAEISLPCDEVIGVVDIKPVEPVTRAVVNGDVSTMPEETEAGAVSDAEPGEVKLLRKPRNVTPVNTTRSSDDTTTAPTTTTATANLRVQTPLVGDASTLSPSADRASPTGTSVSISPSAKVKETDGITVRSRTPSPAKPIVVMAATAASTEVLPAPSPPTITPTITGTGTAKRKRSESTGTSTTMTHPLEEDKFELTQSELERLQRRKTKKSNWDVGDPRKNGGSVDLAALNLLSSTNTPASHPASFAKFPRHRPAYRHSHSLDTKESPFQYRAAATSSVHTSPPPPHALPSVAPRRAFHHSASLPLERSHSATARPSPRYPPSNGGHS